MSVCRRACRHALQPSHPTTRTSFTDHVWISQDFLASVFRSFAYAQCRHGSQVPGPLEARRRLAKRRNTALARIGDFGPLDDVVCLFGRDGREHRPQKPPDVKPSLLGSDGHPLSGFDIPPFSANSNGAGFEHKKFEASRDSTNSFNDDNPSHSRLLEDYLKEHWKVSDIKDVLHQLMIDLQQEPEYSRMIFNSLLSRVGRTKAVIEEISTYLGDPFLNTQGAMNHLTAAEYLARKRTSLATRQALLGAINRALELGLIMNKEIRLIVQTLPKMKIAGQSFTERDPEGLVKCYREMWSAIGRCNVFSHKDLDMELADAWLRELAATGSHMESLLLARDIIVATHSRGSDASIWASSLITQWVKLSMDLNPKVDAGYAHELLSCFNSDIASRCIIRVAESLVLSPTVTEREKLRRKLLLEYWRNCLAQLPVIPSILRSRVWFDAWETHFSEPSDGSGSIVAELSVVDRVLIRIWILRTFNTITRTRRDQIWEPGEVYYLTFNLFNVYRSITQPHDHGDFMSSLVKGIHDLDLPSNGVLTGAVNLLMNLCVSESAQESLWQLESRNISLTAMFENIHTFNATKRFMYRSYEKMIREIDLTSPSFATHCLRIAETGDSESIWTIIRVLRSHSPLKIALSRSWHPIPHPSEMVLVRYHPLPRTSECPDPHAALEFINFLAIAFSCAKRVSPARAFDLVHWLFGYLMQHNAPIKPAFVRALYHAGVTRYQRTGQRVTPSRYNYILRLVKEHETPEVVESLLNPYRAKFQRKPDDDNDDD